MPLTPMMPRVDLHGMISQLLGPLIQQSAQQDKLKKLTEHPMQGESPLWTALRGIAMQRRRINPSWGMNILGPMGGYANAPVNNLPLRINGDSQGDPGLVDDSTSQLMGMSHEINAPRRIGSTNYASIQDPFGLGFNSSGGTFGFGSAIERLKQAGRLLTSGGSEPGAIRDQRVYHGGPKPLPVAGVRG